MTRTGVILLVTAALWWLDVSSALWLNLPPAGSKCVSEEIQSNVVVIADYTIIYDDQTTDVPTMTTKVTSPYGNTLHSQENATTGHFAFTTTESGTYLTCFTMHEEHKTARASVNLEWRIGIAAKDWDSVAKKEKIEGVELELRKLEGAVEAIHENLLYLKSKEAEMRMVSEKTNARVAWFSLMSLTICIVVAGLQLLYLKRYFRHKKLI